MNPLSLDEIAMMCGGLAPAQGGGVRVSRISKDTRILERGDLYFALRGENFDGNKFAADALARGAAGAVLDDPAVAAELMPRLPVILVEDSLVALQRLAAEWRDRLKLKVVGVTGSNGKTSTKEFTAAVLGAHFCTAKTEGNLNNHIGVPLSILAADMDTEAAVWEIGMNHPGEVAPLAKLVRPDVVIVSNIGVSHIEFFGSREAIAREKGELLAALPANGTAIFPNGDDFSDTLESLTRARVVRVGGDKSAIRADNIEVLARETKFTLWANGEMHTVTLPVAGRHMVSNALCAVAAGLVCGMEVSECAEALACAEVANGRLTPREIDGVCYLDDTYNANPDSMCAAFETLKNIGCSGRRVAVLGRMGELGIHAEEGYTRVGRAAAQVLDCLIAVGSETETLVRNASEAGLVNVQRVSNTAEAAEALKKFVRAGDMVLVKGSRSAKMETLFDNLDKL